MNFFDHKNLGSHLLQLCLKVVKHPVLCCILGNWVVQMGVGWNKSVLGVRKEISSTDPLILSVQLLPFPPTTFFLIFSYTPLSPGVLNPFCDMCSFQSLAKPTDPFPETRIKMYKVKYIDRNLCITTCITICVKK